MRENMSYASERYLDNNEHVPDNKTWVQDNNDCVLSPCNVKTSTESSNAAEWWQFGWRVIARNTSPISHHNWRDSLIIHYNF